jgi:hypothetical protein
MEKINASGKPYAHLSLTEATKGKLNQVNQLMYIHERSIKVNDEYYEIFGVNKEKEALCQGKQPVHSTWKPTLCLDPFAWDKACEYPIGPAAQSVEEEDDNSINKDHHDMHGFDQCLIPLYRSMLEEKLKEPQAREVIQPAAR